MRGLRKIAAIGALTFAFTGVASTANAAPAQAATVIYGNCYTFNAQLAGPSRACWVDYSWAEEVFQRKRDCYCHITPILYR